MDPALHKASTGAFSGFLSHFGGRQGQLDGMKAGSFFSEQRKREEAQRDNFVVLDREHPQKPPHTYIGGAPVSPLHYGVPLSDDIDPGVFAVSTALFGGAPAFTSIPIEPRPVFRRRRRGDGYPEWSNAFVTRVDPCECINPEETYTPYEVARYRDQQGRTQTTLSFSA